MKKLFATLLLCAVGMSSFTSCSSDDESDYLSGTLWYFDDDLISQSLEFTSDGRVLTWNDYSGNGQNKGTYRVEGSTVYFNNVKCYLYTYVKGTFTEKSMRVEYIDNLYGSTYIDVFLKR